jgi:LEA14-like dessication related protein
VSGQQIEKAQMTTIKRIAAAISESQNITHGFFVVGDVHIKMARAAVAELRHLDKDMTVYIKREGNTVKDIWNSILQAILDEKE